MKKPFLLVLISMLLFTAAGASPPNVSKDVKAYAFVQSNDAMVPSDYQINAMPAMLIDSYQEVTPVERTRSGYNAYVDHRKESNIPLTAYKVNRMKNSK